MEFVTVERHGNIASVRFTRETVSNTLSHGAMRELTGVARELAEDATLSAVILSGRAENFCLGFDLKDPELADIRKLPLAEKRLRMQSGANMCRAWEEIEALTITAIEGWCVGGGVAQSRRG